MTTIDPTPTAELSATGPDDRPTVRRGLSRSSHEPNPFPEYGEHLAATLESIERTPPAWTELIADAIAAAGPDRTVHVDIRFTVEPK